MGGQQFSWSFESCWSWNPQSSQPAAPAGYLLCCFQTMCLCERREIAVSVFWTKWSWSRVFLCALQELLFMGFNSWFLFRELFLPLYPISPLHSLKQGIQIQFRKLGLCSWTFPAGAHNSLAGQLWGGTSHCGWEKPFPHPWCQLCLLPLAKQGTDRFLSGSREMCPNSLTRKGWGQRRPSVPSRCLSDVANAPSCFPSRNGHYC